MCCQVERTATAPASRDGRIWLCFVLMAALGVAAATGSAMAQGTAPAQGVTRPSPPPNPQAEPPAPKPEHLTDGQPRPDPGGDGTRTAPDTTARVPLPPPGQADPAAPRR